MDLISWVEFQRLLGVDSIFVYAMSFTVEVRDVLEFYVRKGVVEVIEWNFHISNGLPCHILYTGCMLIKSVNIVIVKQN